MLCHCATKYEAFLRLTFISDLSAPCLVSDVATRGCHEILQLRMIENQGTYSPTLRFYLYTFNERVDISHNDWGNVLGEMQAQYFRVACLLRTSLGLITEYI